MNYLSNPKDEILYFNTFAGSGKTITVTNATVKKEIFFIYLSPTHKGAYSNVADRHGLVQMESRQRLCSEERYKKLERYGVSLRHVCRSVCRKIGQCEYFLRMSEIFRQPQSWSGVHSHLPGLVRRYIEEFPDITEVVILDENFIGTAIDEINMDYDSISWNIECMAEMSYSHAAAVLIEIFELIRQAMSVKELPNISQILRYCRELEESGDNKNIDCVASDYEEHLTRKFLDGQKIPYNYLRQLVMVIKNTESATNKIGFLRSVFKCFESRKTGKFVVNMAVVRKDGLAIEKPIVILDATTPPQIYSSLFKRPVRSIKLPHHGQGHYFQVTSGRYPMASLENKNIFTRLTDITKLICEIHNRILIVIRKRFVPRLKSYLTEYDNFEVDYYGRLRGLNVYEDCDACVLFGEPYPNLVNLNRQAGLLELDPNDLFFLAREAEMVQALERVRPALNKDVSIYLLSNVKLPFINPKRLPVSHLKKYLMSELTSIRLAVKTDDIRELIYDRLQRNELTRDQIISDFPDRLGLAGVVLDEMVESGIVRRKYERNKLTGATIKLFEVSD